MENALSFETFSPIIEAVTTSISPATILGIIGGVVGAGIAFVFTWWGARKGLAAIKDAVLHGKLSV